MFLRIDWCGCHVMNSEPFKYYPPTNSNPVSVRKTKWLAWLHAKALNLQYVDMIESLLLFSLCFSVQNMQIWDSFVVIVI